MWRFLLVDVILLICAYFYFLGKFLSLIYLILWESLEKKIQAYVEKYSIEDNSKNIILILSCVEKFEHWWKCEYRGSLHFVISQFVIPTISWFYFRALFLEFLSISWFCSQSRCRTKGNRKNFDFCLSNCPLKESNQKKLWFFPIKTSFEKK